VPATLPHPSSTRTALRDRLWREWCFARVVWAHSRLRLLVLLLVLVGGGSLFVLLEPEKRHSLPKATYMAWSLVFAQAPEDFPTSPALQALFFVVPVVGLTIVIEGIVDLAFVLRDRRRSERGWCKMMASSLSDHIVLVGLGKLGYRTYQLLKGLGEAVVVIERDPQNQFLEVLRRDGTPFFVGDARQETLLEDANVARARSIVLATDNDLANLEAALDARRVAPRIRVVLRMFDQNMADKIRGGFDIHIAMSQSAMSAPAFATAAIDATIINSFVLDGALVVLQRWAVQDGGPLLGRTVGDLAREHGVVVLSWQRRDGAPRFPPPADTPLVPGDRLVVQGPFPVLQGLRRTLGPAIETRSTDAAIAAARSPR
jgi:voltage-gated potassium channel